MVSSRLFTLLATEKGTICPRNTALKVYISKEWVLSKCVITSNLTVCCILQIRVEMLVPNRECNVASLCFSSFSDAYFLFINNRPVRNKEVEKVRGIWYKIYIYKFKSWLNDFYLLLKPHQIVFFQAVYNKIFEFFGVYIPAKKYPICVTSLVVPADCLDVNLEPDKTRVYIKNQVILKWLVICGHYNIQSTPD